MSKKPVSFVEDPFQSKSIEIAEAQNSDEPLELDEPQDDEAEEALERVSAAVTAAELETASHVETISPVDAQAELARQIAEDQALEAQLKAEDEAEDAGPSPLLNAEGVLDQNEVQSCIETLLFMSDKPLSTKKLHELLGPGFEQEIFESAMRALVERYGATHHGFALLEIAGGWQFRTKPGRANLARKLAKVQTQRLSSGGMETLAIIAYRQPVLKDDIDKIRGVDSSYFIRGLLDKKLIQISGRSELPGRPMLYSTTDEFLSLFSLKDLASLPPLHELEKMVPASQTKNPEDEDPRVREMRKLVEQMRTNTETDLRYDPREDAKILQEIRERVSSIPTSTPYLDEQKAAEKAAALAAQNPSPEAGPEQPELPVEAAPPVPLAEAPAPEASEGEPLG